MNINSPKPARVHLYWLPLGAGGHFVRLNGRAYEAIKAVRERRARTDLYHAALEISSSESRFVIEMGPVWNVDTSHHGSLLEGPVGSQLLGRSRWFRYEVRCWQDGVIPDIAECVDSPQLVTADHVVAAAILDSVGEVPPLVWGRDELRLGEMWNSNSLVAWLLTRHGVLDTVRLPSGGSAPGWKAGIRLAQQREAPPLAI